MSRAELPKALASAPPSVQRLDSGYWHVRFDLNRFVQWPCGRLPREEDGFGWLSPAEYREAARLTQEEEKQRDDGGLYKCLP